MAARIVKIVSKEYTVLREDGSMVKATMLGRIRLVTKPAVGDLVEVIKAGESYAVSDILPRKSMMTRPFIANVDQALIVMSVVDPDFSTVLVDRLSALIMKAGILPVLIVTKCDLSFSEDTENRIGEYERGPMKVVRCGDDYIDPKLAGILKGRISVLTGQSGSGKSTLLNHLDPSFHLATQSISRALGRGKHTTRHTELLPVAGGLVADTPGFSSLDLSAIDLNELAYYVPDFAPYLGKCFFNDCIHENEPGCFIKENVEKGMIPRERYKNYLQILNIIKERKDRYQ